MAGVVLVGGRAILFEGRSNTNSAQLYVKYTTVGTHKQVQHRLTTGILGARPSYLPAFVAIVAAVIPRRQTSRDIWPVVDGVVGRYVRGNRWEGDGRLGWCVYHGPAVGRSAGESIGSCLGAGIDT